MELGSIESILHIVLDELGMASMGHGLHLGHDHGEYSGDWLQSERQGSELVGHTPHHEAHVLPELRMHARVEVGISQVDTRPVEWRQLCPDQLSWTAHS